MCAADEVATLRGCAVCPRHATLSAGAARNSNPGCLRLEIQAGSLIR